MQLGINKNGGIVFGGICLKLKAYGVAKLLRFKYREGVFFPAQRALEPVRASRLAFFVSPFVLADVNTSIGVCDPLTADIAVISFQLLEKWFHGVFHFSFTGHYQSFVSKDTSKILFMQALFSG
jgi:hypothetical protein